jgi:hypothetical protein
MVLRIEAETGGRFAGGAIFRSRQSTAISVFKGQPEDTA